MALVPALASAALAGEIDPNPGDTNLGTVGGITYRSDPERFGGPTGSGSHAFTTAGCGPQSRHVLGGGVSATGAAAERKVASNLPRDDSANESGDTLADDGWEAGGSGPLGRRITAYAICAELPIERLRYLGAEPPDTGQQERAGQVACGGGRWHATGGGGLAAPEDAYLSASRPLDLDADTPADDGWNLDFFDPLAGIGGANVSVVCRRGAGLAYRYAVRDGIADGETGSRKVSCPDGSHVVGGGARVSGAPLDGWFTESYPIDTGSDADDVPDDGWRAEALDPDGYSDRLRVHAVCLR